MNRRHLDDLAIFMTVAEEKSFTRAASRLGLSQSALSHAIKALEAELDVRLLARTTRSVGTTEAGERLLERLRPAVGDIDAALEDLLAMRERPSGTVRITTMKHAATTVLEPALPVFFAAHPGVSVEISVEERLVDIVASRFDAGIRFGESVDRDMIAVRVGDDLRTAICGSPEYSAKHPKPRTPRDLVVHNCINYRFHTSGALYAWEFNENGRPLTIKVSGSLIVNDGDVMLNAVLEGHGRVPLRRHRDRAHRRGPTRPRPREILRALSRLLSLLPEHAKIAGAHRVHRGDPASPGWPKDPQKAVTRSARGSVSGRGACRWQRPRDSLAEPDRRIRGRWDRSSSERR
jgi:DNA-binding transcriptional LysR family regulator